MRERVHKIIQGSPVSYPWLVASRGTGSALYHALLEQLREQGIRTAIGIVTAGNPGSERLHRRFGFERVGRLTGVGFKFNQWLDTEYWQKELD